MLIRAYRVRGHLARRSRSARPRAAGDHGARSAHLRLHRGRPRPPDLHRRRARPGDSRRCARSSTSCARTYCGTLGIEFMHISDPAQKGWIQERIEGPDKEITFTARGQARDPEQADRGRRRSSASATCKYIGTKRFGLDGAESMIPALEQIIKRGGELGVRGDRDRHAAPRPPERARERDGQALPRDLPRIQGRLVRRPTRSTARATSNITWARRPTASSTATRCTCRSPPTPRISRSSIRSCSARCAPSRISMRDDRTTAAA